MRRGERGRTRIRESIGRCVLVVRDTAHLLEGRRGSRRRGKVIGAIARPLMSLQTREWNLILITRAEGGGLGRIACPLMSLLIQTRVWILIMITREAGGDLGSIARLGI